MDGSTSISFYIYMLKVNNVILDFILRSIEFTIYLAALLDFNATSYCAHTRRRRGRPLTEPSSAVKIDPKLCLSFSEMKEKGSPCPCDRAATSL
jgi:hypothetical protein